MINSKQLFLFIALLLSVSAVAQPVSLPGKIDVSAIGAATYTVPIDVVPGTGGIQPNIAVVYNSLSGIGVLGQKWSLQGLHSITRTGQSLRIDGMITPADFSTNDRFSLDGNRLLLVEGHDYHSSDAVYGFEVEDFSRVRRVTDGGTVYFVQEYADGGTVEYGRDAQSRIESQDGTCLVWLAERMTDINGNSMTFTYDQSDGEAWIERINYTYTADGGQPYASVEFGYTDMARPNDSYVCGVRLRQSKLLTDIAVMYSDNQVRRYRFDYDADGQYERLKGIALLDDNDNEMTETGIQWDEPPQYLSTTMALQNTPDGNFYACGNFTDDRIYDIAMVNRSTGDMILYRGQADGTFGQAEALDINFGSNPLTVIFESMTACDLDGDGIDEILLYEPLSVTWYSINLRDLSHPVQSTLMTSASRAIQFGDFDGDGVTEAVALSPNGILVAYGLRGSYPSTYSLGRSYKDFRTGDFDGDGKAELILLYDLNSDRLSYNPRTDTWDNVENDGFPNSYQYLVTGDFNGDGLTDLLFLPNNETLWKVAVRHGKNIWSTPTPVTTLDGTHVNDGTHAPNWIPIVCDINGDGRGDIIQQRGSGTVLCVITGGVDEGASGGDYMVYDTYTFYLPSGQSLDPGHFSLGDFDCNGVADIFLGHHSQSGHYCNIIYFNKGSHAGRLVENITDGAGRSTEIIYSAISLMPRRWMGGGVMWTPLTLVKDIVVPDGVGGNDTTLYYYGDAMFDNVSLRFIGFGRLGVRVADHYTGTFLSRLPSGGGRLDMLVPDSVVCRVVPQTPQQALAHYLPSGTLLIQPSAPVVSRMVALNTSLTRTNPDGTVTFIPYSPRVTEDNLLTNTRTVTRSSLDSRWMPFHKAVDKGYVTGSSAVPQYDSVAYTYSSVTLPNGVVRRLVSRTVECGFNSPSRDVARVRETLFTYSGGRLASRRVTDNGGVDVTESYTYTLGGLLRRLTTTPAGASSRHVTYTYDVTGRFVTDETDHGGRSVSRTFDGATGLTLAETDINGLVTRRAYDSWGRTTRVLYPDSTWEAFVYSAGNDGYSDVVAHTTVSASGQAAVHRCYDLLGREVHSYAEGGGYSDVVYNRRGQVERETLVPGELKHPAAAGKLWNIHTYDVHGRLVKDSSICSRTTYIYGVPSGDFRHSVTSTDRRGAFSTRRHDAAGRVVEAVDNGGVVTYAYDRVSESGVVLDRTVITAAGNTTTMISDSRGNRLRITDPDAGTVTSTYNVWNELLTHTDGKGDVTTMAYDNLGRMTAKTYGSGNSSETYTYTYGTAAPALDKVVSVAKGGIDCGSILYDRLGRVASDTRLIDGTGFTHTYTYDTAGRLRTVRYPDGYRIRRAYDNLGRLAGIANDSTGLAFYYVDRRNRAGQVERAWYSNGTGVQYTYDELFRPVEIRHGHTVVTWPPDYRGEGTRSDPFEPPLDSIGNDIVGPEGPELSVGNQYAVLRYTYDADGYITGRQDTRTSQREDYIYDALGRLTSYTIDNTYTYTFSYSADGNMLSNSRVSAGEYSYDATQPHAVSGVAAREGMVSASRCDVTWGVRNRATAVTQDNWRLDLSYGDGLQREKTVLSLGNFWVRTTYYAGDDCEVEVTPSGTRHIDIIRADGRVVALHVRKGSLDSLYFVHTDLVGSWERVVDGGKNVVQASHFDPWGNRMSATDWTASQNGVPLPFHRGFTGHEHYDRFGIINMNARLYDPVIARFFSPDPQVQNPFSTQGFNRYSYCGNNPVMYKDPNGEFFVVDSWILGFIHGFTSTGSDRWRTAWKTANRFAGIDLKIWGGLFVTDPNKSTMGQTWEVISRFTWQLPQTVAGFTIAQACNTAEGLGLYAGIESVNYKYGATVVTHKSKGWGAVTLGSYINGSCSLEADPSNSLFQHEYGHYIQSQGMGLFYLKVIGIPSGLNCLATNKKWLGDTRHNSHPTEQDANVRAFSYFNKNIKNFITWDFIHNPIEEYNINLLYDDPINQSALQKGIINLAWYEYLIPIPFFCIELASYLNFNIYRLLMTK